MIKELLLLFPLICPAYSMDDIIQVDSPLPKTRVVNNDILEDSFTRIERTEESYMVKTAFCCRISGNVVDVIGSITGYCTAGLATMSALPGVADDVKRYLAIAAGVGGVVTGILHNIKPLVDRISKEKQERAEALHNKHLGV